MADVNEMKSFVVELNMSFEYFQKNRENLYVILANYGDFNYCFWRELLHGSSIIYFDL